MKSVKDEGIVTQLAVVATMMPKVKEYIDQQADRIAELEKAAQRMVDEFAPHADKCRPCTIEWQNLRSVLVKGMK